MSEKRKINGVDVDQLFSTVEAIKGKPEIAKFKFRVNSEWVDGARSRTTVGDFYGACETHSHSKPFVLEQDEHPVLLGEDRAAGPADYLLTALAGCLTTSLVYHAAARGVKIDTVEAAFEGDADLRGFLGLSEEVRNGFEGIRVTLKVKGDASEKELEELVELAKQRSPIFDTIANPVPVSVQYESAAKTVAA